MPLFTFLIIYQEVRWDTNPDGPVRKLLLNPDEPPKHYISIRNLRMHNNQVLENRTTCQNILFCCEHKRVIELILLGSTWHQSIKFCPLSGSSQIY